MRDPDKSYYQLVAFPGEKPTPGQVIYGDAATQNAGWLPQVALKRRFTVEGIDEQSLINKVTQFAAQNEPIVVSFGEAMRPEHMPVDVIEIVNKAEVTAFHKDFLAFMGDDIESRYSDREGDHFYPHMTIEWNGARVVSVEDWIGKEIMLTISGWCEMICQLMSHTPSSASN